MASIPRSPSSPLEIAIIGAGPIGLEAALYASALGHRPTVYERLEAGASINFVLPFAREEAEAFWRDKVLPG